MPEITEARLYEAFGLKAPEKDPGKGEQVQEPADPVSETVPADIGEGAQAQESAEPAPEEAIEQNEPDTTGEPEVQEDPGIGGKQPLTQEQRRENAARRRQQEQQAAIEQAVRQALTVEREKHDGEMKDFFAKMGMKNSFNGQPITNMDEFNAWKQEYDTQQLNKSLKDGKLTAEQLNQVIASHPAVQQAQAMIQQNRQSQDQQQSAAEQERINTELAEIGKLSAQIGGKINGVQDLLTMPKSEQFRGYVAKGYSFLDAYKLTHMDELSNAKAEAAKRQAINNDRGKDHLTAFGNPRGSGAVSVPADQMRLFRAMNPNATDAQIQAYYNKYKSKHQGG